MWLCCLYLHAELMAFFPQKIKLHHSVWGCGGVGVCVRGYIWERQEQHRGPAAVI